MHFLNTKQTMTLDLFVVMDSSSHRGARIFHGAPIATWEGFFVGVALV